MLGIEKFGERSFLNNIRTVRSVHSTNNRAAQLGAIMREEMAYFQHIASPQVKFDFWQGVGHGIKAAKPAEYNKALESWLLD